MMSFFQTFRLNIAAGGKLPDAKTGDSTIFPRLPAEILIRIFIYLPNLYDVISLVGASRRLRLIYIENSKPIYDKLAPRTFSFHERARQLLADGGGPDLEERLSPFYLATMFRNWKIVKAAMAEFELQMKQGMKSYKTHPIAHLDLGSHAPYLTRPEKRRFIRTYYTLWSLMRIKPDLWQARLSRLSLRDLYYIHELCRLAQSIGREEYHPSSKKRGILRLAIWDHISPIHLAVHGHELSSGCSHVFTEGEYFWFGRFWDHWQFILKILVCGQNRADLWEESDDDEPVHEPK